jgi:hypothetical protein
VEEVDWKAVTDVTNAAFESKSGTEIVPQLA